MPHKARLLLVDRNEVDHVITKRLLDSSLNCDYQLDWVSDPDEAIRILRRGKHDLCLLDTEASSDEGLGFLRNAAATGIDIPFVLLSNGPSPELDRRASALGVRAILNKERLGAEDLERSVRFTLECHALVRQLLDHNAELMQLHALTNVALENESLEDACRAAARRIADMVGVPISAIELWDPATSSLHLRGFTGEAQEAPGVSAWAGSEETYQQARPHIEYFHSGDTREVVLGTPVKSLASLPLTVCGEVRGVLTLADTGDLVLDSDDITLAGTLGNHFVGTLRRLLPATHPVATPSRDGSDRAPHSRGLESEFGEVVVPGRD